MMGESGEGVLLTEDGFPIARETPTIRKERVYLSDDQGNTRVFEIWSPIGVVPVGMNIHLHGGYGSGFGDYTDGTEAGLNNGGLAATMNYASAFEQQWVNVYPNAIYNPNVLGLCWVAGTAFEYSGNPDDEDFIDAVATYVKERYSFSTNKFAVTGVSAGAMEALRYTGKAYREDFTYKPTHLISINGVIAFDNTLEPYEATCKVMSITSDQDTIVPPTGGGFGSYMTRTAFHAIISAFASSTTYIIMTYGQHGVKYTRIGLANHSPVKSLQTWIEEFLA